MSSPSTIACYAKLMGPHHSIYYLTRPRATLGRSVSYPEGTLYESGDKVPIADFFVGSSPRISRIHCMIDYSVGSGAVSSRYEVRCCSKNGMSVDGVFLSRDDGAFVLRSRSLLVVGDSCWYFLLPRDSASSKYGDAIIRPPAAAFVPIPLITRSSRMDEQERERQRDEQRKKEKEEKKTTGLQLLGTQQPASTSPSPASHSPTPGHRPQQPALPPAPPPLPADSWTRIEREAMKEALLCFPVARPDVLQEELRKEGIKKTDAEVEVFVTAFIAALMKHAGSSLTRALRLIWPSSASLLLTPPAASSSSSSSSSTISALRPATPTPLLFSLLTWNALSKQAKHWARRLLQLHTLHQHMISRGSLHLLDDLRSETRGRLPAVWWSRACDVDLLVGLYRWGYGRFDRMREDRQLVFRKIMDDISRAREAGGAADKQADSKEAGDSAEEAEGEAAAAEEGDEDDEDEDAEDEDTADDDAEGNDSSASSASDKPRRKKSKTASAAAAPSAAPSPPPFPPRTLFGPVSRGKTEDGWPISLALVGRFRQLLKVMRTRDAKEAEERKRKAEGGAAAGGHVHKRGGRVLDGFDDDERSVLTKALLIVGTPASSSQPASGASAASSASQQPDWSALRTGWPQLAGKKDPEFSARVEEMRKEAAALLAPLNERLLLAGLHRDSLALLSSLIAAPTSASLPPVLTPLLSAHLLSHLHYFSFSRSALGSLPSSFAAPPPPSPAHPLPAWWKAGTHDRYLVLALNRHGLRPRAIDDDLAYPYKMYSSNSQYGGLDGWMAEVGPGRGVEALITRWKQVVDWWSKERREKAVASGGGEAAAAAGVRAGAATRGGSRAVKRSG